MGLLGALLVLGAALPAVAQECGYSATQVATFTDGEWGLSDGPLVSLTPAGERLTWTSLPGVTVDTVAVETGVEASDGAAVSAAVMVPGGAAGDVPLLDAPALSVIFRGTAGCDVLLEVVAVDSAQDARVDPEVEEVPPAAAPSAALGVLRAEAWMRPAVWAPILGWVDRIR